MSFSPAALALLLLLISCTNGSTSPNVLLTGSTASVPVTPASVPSCTNAASVRAQFGHTCAVTGKYVMKTFPGKGGGTLGDWPILVLDDGSEVMIDSLWDPSKKPDTATIERFQAKRVEVVGQLQSSPPKELPENFFFPCISPVHTQRIVP